MGHTLRVRDALGHRNGSFSLAPAPADVPSQNGPSAPLAAPVPVGSEGSPSPEDSWRCWKGSNKMNEWDNTRADSAPEPKPCWWDRMGIMVLGIMEQQAGARRGEVRADFGAAAKGRVSLGLAAAGAWEKQGFSPRLSPWKLQNKGKLCKTSCRRTLVPNRHVVGAAKAPAQGDVT